MMVDKKYLIIGTLLITLLVSGIIYVQLGDKVKFRVDNDKTTIYTKEAGRWLVSGREYNKLFDGTSQMNRDISSIKVINITEGNIYKVIRTTKFIRGPVIIDTYTYDGSNKDVYFFPLDHKIEVIGAKDKFYRYEARDLVYDGKTLKLNGETSFDFGRNIKINWQSGYRWAWIYKTGILKVQYKLNSDYEVFHIRMFDPPPVLYLDGVSSNRQYEYRSLINISANNSAAITCLSLNAPGYGNNYACSSSDNLLFNDSFDRADASTVGNGWLNTTSASSTVNISNNRVWIHLFTGSAILNRTISFTKLETNLAFNNTANGGFRFYNGSNIVYVNLENTGSTYTFTNDSTTTTLCTTVIYKNVTLIAEYLNTTHFNISCINDSTLGTIEKTSIYSSGGVLSDGAFSYITFSGGNSGDTRSLWVNNATFYGPSLKNKVSFIYNASILRNDNYTVLDQNNNRTCYQEYFDIAGFDYVAAVANPDQRSPPNCGEIYNGTYNSSGQWSSGCLGTGNLIDGLGSTTCLAASDGDYAYLQENYSIPINYNNSLLPTIGFTHNAVDDNVTASIYCMDGNVRTLYRHGNEPAGNFNLTVYCGNSSSTMDDVTTWTELYVNESTGYFGDGRIYWHFKTGNYANLSMDNRSEIDSAMINISSAGTSHHLSISYGNSIKSFAGNLTGDELYSNQFEYKGSTYDDTNLSIPQSGSQIIYVNLSDNPKNLSFQLTGYRIDAGNGLDFYEYFNQTNLSFFDYTASVNTSGYKGYFDMLKRNVTADYTKSGNCQTNSWTNASDIGRWTLSCSGGDPTISGNFLVPDLNLKNHSLIELNATITCSCSCQAAGDGCTGNSQFELTDGTSTVPIYSCTQYCDGDTKSESRSGILRLYRKSHSINTWSFYDDGVLISSFSTSSLSTSKDWNLRFTGSGQGYQNGGSGTTTLNYIVAGGIYLNVTDLYEGKYSRYGNFTSGIVDNTSTTYIAATLTAIDYAPSGTVIHYLMSANESNFEAVTSGERHVFVTSGNMLKWKVDMNTSNVSVTPIVYEVNIEVIDSSPENITIDIGDDGINEYTFNNKLNDTNSPQNLTFNENDLIQYRNTRLPIKVSSKVSGVLNVNKFNISSLINPISLNVSEFETCLGCILNVSYWHEEIRVLDFHMDFFGSKNYSVTASSSEGTESHLIQLYYSNFNLSFPKGINWLDLLGVGANDKNATPFGQSTTKPIRNITSSAYDQPFDVYARTNDTIDCLNITISDGPNQSSSNIVTLNTSFQKILSSVAVNSWNGTWQYYNLQGCSNRFYIPWFEYVTVCSSCVYDADDISNYNVLVD